MEETENTSMRICLDGNANSLALNKENTCIAVAGRSREHLFWFSVKRNFNFLINFSAESV